jgi:hypothetical protein
MTTPCRRCDECANSPHHWIGNSNVALLATEGHLADLTDTEAACTGNLYVCKHCPATGDDCPDCFESDDDTCKRCQGEGIIQVPARTWEQLEAQWEADQSTWAPSLD